MTARSLVAALSACAAIGAAAAPLAGAEEVSRAELESLAERAGGDRAALERLRRVDRVDGRPVDVGGALRGAGAEDAAARARAIAAELAPSGTAPAGARERARALLRERRFTGTDLPRPFARPLRWLEDRLRPAGEAIAGAFEAVARAIPGGTAVAWLLVAALVALVAVLVARQLTGGATPGSSADAGAGRARERPGELERAADAAEREGDWERALRLRFRAGLLRLDERLVLEYRPSRTTGEIAGALQIEAFDRLGDRFDAVAYGGRAAAAEDAERARADWAEVLTAARRR